MIEEAVKRSIEASPASGGALVERLRADGGDLLRGRAVLVYGALANLLARGEIEVVASGPGETVYGPPGSAPRPARPAGLPPSFGLDDVAIGEIDREVGHITAGRARHVFEELRRTVIADADRRAMEGKPPRRAAARALEDLGPPAAARRFLARVERGAPVKLRLRPSLRWVAVVVVVLGCIALVRHFAIGIYRMPPESNSMAPTLVPAAEDGDALVLANLLAYVFSPPRRGDVILFRRPGREATFVKRVIGLGGETIRIDDMDVWVDGERLVKERALLDRVRVRLPGLDGEARWHDLVLETRLTAPALPAAVTITIEDGRGRKPPTLVLAGTASTAGAYVAGIEVARGTDFLLEAGRERELWMTNADGVLRVELDGREVVRATLPPAKGPVRFVIRAEGVELEASRLYRDLEYAALAALPNHVWTVGPEELFVLGDNPGHSRDSRQDGPLSRDTVLGRVFAVAWPPDRIRGIR